MGSSCVRAAVPTRASCHFFVGSLSLFPLPALFAKHISPTVESHFILHNTSLSVFFTSYLDSQINVVTQKEQDETRRLPVALCLPPADTHKRLRDWITIYTKPLQRKPQLDRLEAWGIQVR